MGRFFHLDRRAQLYEGVVIERVAHKDVQPSDLQEHVDAMFPKGVTEHGRQYFVGNTVIGPVQEPAIELLFEYVRRASFADTPSRFESVFAFNSLADAQQFRADTGAAGAAIWEVEAEPGLRADMNYLRLVGVSALTVSYFAHRYWAGESSAPDSAPEALWEYLLLPPVRVVARVPEP
jgi:hypothetical protein